MQREFSVLTEGRQPKTALEKSLAFRVLIQSNFSTTVTLGTKESGRCLEVAVTCEGRGVMTLF